MSDSSLARLASQVSLVLRFVALLPEQRIDLLDEVGKIGLIDAKAVGRDAVALDVRRDMLVIRVSGRQPRFVGMRLGIVPIEPPATLVDGIAASRVHAVGEVEILPRFQRDLVVERERTVPVSLANAAPSGLGGFALSF